MANGWYSNLSLWFEASPWALFDKGKLKARVLESAPCAGLDSLKGEGNTVLSTTGETGTLKGTNPSVTATSPLTLWGSASHALFSALEPKH